MEIVRIDTIVVTPHRQRTDFNDRKLSELENSIGRNGLFHAIMLENPTSRRLISGERRLRAISRLKQPYRFDGAAIATGWVPVVYRGECDPLTLEECELEENIIREDLSWKDRADAIARLHTLRATQAGERGEKQTFTATAQEVKGGDNVSAVDITEVRNATLLRPFLDDPEVKKAASEREAMSIVRKKLTQEFQLRLATQFDSDRGRNSHSPINGSCIDVLPTLPSGIFDVIITDPPYGIDAHKMSTMSQSQSGVVHEYSDTVEDASLVWHAIFAQGARVCKPQAHLYMFCDFRHFERLRAMAESLAWDVWPTPIIWHKPGGGMLGDSTRGPRKSYETILYARRGDKKVTGVYLDVIVENGADASMHAAAKPVSVYSNLLRRSVLPGDYVLDPCMGSGTIFPAANRLRLVATGIELSQTHYATALMRVSGEE